MGFYGAVCGLYGVLCGCVGYRGHYGTAWCFIGLCGLYGTLCTPGKRALD